MLQGGLWVTNGKSPAATVNSVIATDIKQNGAKSRFIRTAPGTFSLRQSGAVVAVTTGPAPSATVEAALSQPVATITTSSLSFTDAAEQVLKQVANKQPMHYKAITAEALKRGFLFTTGQTPEATLRGVIYTEIDRCNQRGRTPRFVLHGKGLIGLSEWQPIKLVQLIDQHNRGVRKELHLQLLALAPSDFEALVGRLLRAMGFEVVVTKPSGDGGIDVRGTLVVGDVIKIAMAVQVKRWKINVQAPTVQMVRGSLTTHEHGMIITTSNFSDGACKDAAKPNSTPIALMNGDQMVDLLVEHSIGIHKGVHGLLELGDAEDS
jgi:restriction system protein